MEKEIVYFYGDNDSEVLELLNSGSFVKTANIATEIVNFIKGLKSDGNKTYALLSALSAGEYFGPNRNGDYFPENELINHHKTFEEYGHVFKHHVNKDPKKAFGKVLFSHMNPEMKRVELIIEIDNSKSTDVVSKLQAGQLPAVSMGCKVPYDICSICGNKAKTRAEYCSHLTKDMNKIYTDGRRVYAINENPKFFDISIVVYPADETASFLKVFGLNKTANSSLEKTAEVVEFNQKNAYIKIAEQSRIAAINKKVDVTVEAVNEDPKKLLNLCTKKLTHEQIEKLSEYPLKDILSTFHVLRIVPSEQEFQKLALYSTGHKKLADSLEKKGYFFKVNYSQDTPSLSGVAVTNFNYKIASMLENDIPELALTKELLVARGITKAAMDQNPGNLLPEEKKERSGISKFLFGHTPDPTYTPSRNPIVPLGILGALYAGYIKVFNNPSASSFRSFIHKNPWLLPVLVGGASFGTAAAQQTFLKSATSVDKFVRNSLISFPVTYFAAGSAENKVRQGEPISRTSDFIRKHPALTALAASLGGTVLENKLLKSTNSKDMLKWSCDLTQDLTEEQINIIYNDLITGG